MSTIVVQSTVDDFVTIFLNFVFPTVQLNAFRQIFSVLPFLEGNKIKRAVHTMPNVPRTNNMDI